MPWSDHLSVLVTPKIFKDFDDPKPDALRFFEFYGPWFERFDKLVVIVGVGNSDHVLDYPGTTGRDRAVAWARYSNHHIDEQGSEQYGVPMQRTVSKAELTYDSIAQIARVMREAATETGLEPVKIVDMIDGGPEFCECPFKSRHLEMMDLNDPRNPKHVLKEYAFVDMLSTLHADPRRFAAYPEGIVEGEPTRHFIARQAGRYCDDLELDGYWLTNAYGSVRVWDPDKARGHSDDEEEAIRDFYQQLRAEIGPDRTLIWFDSYWPVETEHQYWSIPPELYRLVDYVQISTYAVLVKPENIRPNIESKLAAGAKVIYSIDTVDPWYDYRTFIDHPDNLEMNLQIFGEYKDRLSGLQVWCSDTNGRFLPRPQIEQLMEVCV